MVHQRGHFVQACAIQRQQGPEPGISIVGLYLHAAVVEATWPKRTTMFFKRILHYLDPRTLFGRSDPNSSLRFMHGVNRISFFLFLFCVVVMIVRACSKP